MNWINVNDRLPDGDEDRLLVWEEGTFYNSEGPHVLTSFSVVQFTKGKFVSYNSIKNEDEDITHFVTHWCKIEKPK